MIILVLNVILCIKKNLILLQREIIVMLLLILFLTIYILSLNPKHKINWDEISILDVEQYYWKRRTSEMLNIHLQQLPINKKDDTKSLHISIIKNIKFKFKNTDT